MFQGLEIRAQKQLNKCSKVTHPLASEGQSDKELQVNKKFFTQWPATFRRVWKKEKVSDLSLAGWGWEGGTLHSWTIIEPWDR